MTGPRDPHNPGPQYGPRKGGRPQTLLPDLVCRLAGQIYAGGTAGIREAIRQARREYDVPDDEWMYGGGQRVAR